MSRSESYAHLVWSTLKRNPLIVPEVEAWLYPFIIKLAKEQGYDVLAINGMPDHVHIVIQWMYRVDYSDLMKRIKGASATYINQQLGLDIYFRWNEGYFARTITPAHLPTILGYVQKQKQHHVEGKIQSRWELTNETISSDTSKSTHEKED